MVILYTNASYAQQPVVLPSVPEDLREPYQQLLQDPDDLEAMWSLAREAERRGLDAFAVRLYERMLLTDERLMQPRLRLVRLHAERGAFLLAQTYLDEVLASGDLPPEVQQRAEAYREEIARALSRHRTVGAVRFGLRHATNPAAVTDFLDDIDDLAVTQLSDDRSDQSAYAALNLTHRYDFLTQREDRLESDLFFYGEKQRRADEVDTAFLEVEIGPRLALLAPLEQRSLRPYAIGRMIGLENALFSGEAGAGVELALGLTRRLNARSGLEATYAWHNNYTIGDVEEDAVIGNFENDDRDGLRLAGEVGLETLILPSLRGSLTVFASHAEAREDLRENRELGARAQLRATLDPPFKFTPEPWTLALAGSYGRTRFDRDDFLPERRTEDRASVDFLTQVPLSRRLAVELRLAHSDVDSSLSGADYDNSEIAIGVVYSFGG